MLLGSLGMNFFCCPPRAHHNLYHLLAARQRNSVKNITFLLHEFAVEAIKLRNFAVQTQFHHNFLTSQSTDNRVQAYGIWNRPQHTSIMIKRDRYVFTVVNDALLNMIPNLTRNQRESPPTGPLQLKVRKFHGYTTFKFLSQLRELANALRRAPQQTVIECPHQHLSRITTSVQRAMPSLPKHHLPCTAHIS